MYLGFLPLVLGIVNMVVSIKFCKPENRVMMFNATILVKYAMILVLALAVLGLLVWAMVGIIGFLMEANG